MNGSGLILDLGAAKAGTTSLHHYLGQHPDVFVSQLKEPKYFALKDEPLDFQGPSQFINDSSVNTFEDYCALFQDVQDETAIGEASPLYLYSKKAVREIKVTLPEAKLIVILRNPVDRAFSSYTHLLREGFETLSFEESLTHEEERIRDRWAPLWYYKDKGFYGQQLQRYYDQFPRENIRVYLFEDLCKDPLAVVRDIFTYIGVEPSFEPDMAKKNVSGVPKNVTLQRLLTRKNPVKSVGKLLLPKKFRKSLSNSIQSKNLGKKPTLKPETRAELLALYREDILHLQGLIDRDLSAWLS
ncbi:MAG: sulfotransferase [Acaryochloridaceae cyanobacterium RL_2_7]|nr:sulfotransferase [Acaryochloridaceae cyanobacterium RL_2_7]